MLYLFTHHQKKKTARLAILQATPKSVFSILLSWTFALPPDVEGSLVSCDLCRCEAGVSGFIQGHAQLQERSGPSKPQLTGWIRLRAGLRRAAVEHSQPLLDRLHIGYTPGSALRSRLLVFFLLAWCPWLSMETMGEYSTVWLQYPHALLRKHPTSWHCPHDGVIVTFNINIYQTLVTNHALYWAFSTQDDAFNILNTMKTPIKIYKVNGFRYEKNNIKILGVLIVLPPVTTLLFDDKCGGLNKNSL